MSQDITCDDSIAVIVNQLENNLVIQFSFLLELRNLLTTELFHLLSPLHNLLLPSLRSHHRVMGQLGRQGEERRAGSCINLIPLYEQLFSRSLFFVRMFKVRHPRSLSTHRHLRTLHYSASWLLLSQMTSQTIRMICRQKTCVQTHRGEFLSCKVLGNHCTSSPHPLSPLSLS